MQSTTLYTENRDGMRELSASYNPFHELILLDLSSNHLQTLDDDFFFYSSNVERLQLDDNKLTDLRAVVDLVKEDTSPFRHMTRLRELSAKSNKIVSELVQVHFQNLHNLQKLDLSDNQIPSIAQEAFYESTMLRELHLSKNRIKSLECGAFAKLMQLEILDLSQNQLSGADVSALGFLPRLETLNLANNQIENLPEAIIFPLLKHLDLSQNLISQVSGDTFQNSQQLFFLNLSRNLLEEGPLVANRSPLIVEASHNHFPCQCRSWEDSTNCTDFQQFSRVWSSDVCVICSKLLEETTVLSLNMSCHDNQKPWKHLSLVATVGAIGGVAMGTILSLVIVCSLKQPKKLGIGQQVNTTGSRPTFRQQVQRLQNSIQTSIRSTAKEESSSMHRYYSIRNQSKSYGSTQPQNDTIYSEINDINPSMSHHRITKKLTNDNSQFVNDDGYCFPIGQSVPAPIDLKVGLQQQTGFDKAEFHEAAEPSHDKEGTRTAGSRPEEQAYSYIDLTLNNQR